MAAATTEINTPESSGDFVSLVVKNDEVIFAGTLVALDGNGEAVNASDTTALRVVGRAEESVDNSADGLSIRVKRGAFWYTGSSVTAAHIGLSATVVDNQTVGAPGATTHDIVAGKIVAVDATLGILVDTRFAGGLDGYSVAGADAAIAAAIAAI
jgi:hypothetical protein